MKLILEVPESWFKPGDFVRYETFGARLLVRIQDVVMSGVFSVLSQKIPLIDYDRQIYVMICQDDCFDAKGNHIRPGTILTQNIEEVDEAAHKISYEGRVWDADTVENIGERLSAWDLQKAEGADGELGVDPCGGHARESEVSDA